MLVSDAENFNGKLTTLGGLLPKIIGSRFAARWHQAISLIAKSVTRLLLAVLRLCLAQLNSAVFESK